MEGFKSYANRVTLSNFDECFNAITGLNGTGKSNILDSICFVLGLKNLQQVRVGTRVVTVTRAYKLGLHEGPAALARARTHRARQLCAAVLCVYV